MADDPSVLLAKIQADKKGVVEKSLNLTAAEAKKFWPLYEKFQRELDVPTASTPWRCATTSRRRSR